MAHSNAVKHGLRCFFKEQPVYVLLLMFFTPKELVCIIDIFSGFQLYYFVEWLHINIVNDQKVKEAINIDSSMNNSLK